MSATVEIQLRQAGPSASEATARNHAVTMDRPEAKGGENRGPMGGEVLLMGLGGCFMSNLLAAAASRDVPLENVRLSIAAALQSAPPRFTDVAMRVSADNAGAEELEKLITIAERGCISANTLKGAVSLTIAPGK